MKPHSQCNCPCHTSGFGPIKHIVPCCDKTYEQLPKTVPCPTCEGSGQVPLMFGTCPMSGTMFNEFMEFMHTHTIFTKVEMEIIRTYMIRLQNFPKDIKDGSIKKPSSMTEEEWKNFYRKIV